MDLTGGERFLLSIAAGSEDISSLYGMERSAASCSNSTAAEWSGLY